MHKKAWPWIESTQYEMGAFSPKNEPTDRQEESPKKPDALTPEKSVLEDSETSMEYQEGKLSPVENLSLAKDEVLLEVISSEKLVAKFSCRVADSLQDKIAGLQTYNTLEQSAGLLFPYDQPTDVIYHMGTVKFPIDIIFINENQEIKKIYKDIQPGNLGVFGSSQIKAVLEICGGLANRLGIKIGDRISFSKTEESNYFNKFAQEMNIDKKIIYHYSDFGSNTIFNWKGFPVLSLNNKLTKFASKPKIVSDFVKFQKSNYSKINVFDLDGLIENNSNLNVYHVSQEHNDYPFVSLSGEIVGIIKNSNDKDLYSTVNFKDLPQYKFSNKAIIKSLSKSFKHFMPLNDETFKILTNLKKSSYDKNTLTLIATRFEKNQILQDVINERLSLHFGEPFNGQFYYLSNEADASDILKSIKNTYKVSDIKIFSDTSLLKRAGNPISNDIKDKAKRAYKLLNSASEIVEKSLDNMKQNVAAYEKIKEDSQAIVNTKGQYNQSIKNNTRVAREFLLKIRDAIKILNEIKDVSTTIKVINGLTSSTKLVSIGLEKIFDLIDQMEAPDFHIILSQAVDEYDKLINDLQSSLRYGMDYINSEILGLMVLSD